MTRKRLTERQTIKTLVAQGAVIPCYRCRLAFEETSLIEREHVTPLALGGEDTPENWRFSHKECHALQTNGTKATSYGSDKHAIAKAKRLRKPRQKPKRRWPTRKIPTRAFPKGD